MRREEFWSELLEDLEAARLGLLEVDPAALKNVSARTQSRGAIPMPKGTVALADLPTDHRAIRFMLENYKAFGDAGLPSVRYISDQYGACFAEDYDDDFPSARDRIIFPIVNGGQQVGWQGRAVSPKKKPRWFLPPGLEKTFYNADNVPPYQTPILNEGLLNAIVCGPRGVAMFGKQLNSFRAEEFGNRWGSVLIATDPDTFVPDNRKGGGGRIFAEELREVMSRHVRTVMMIRWPADILELATRHNNGEDVSVPDAADLGFAYMRRLIEETEGA